MLTGVFLAFKFSICSFSMASMFSKFNRASLAFVDSGFVFSSVFEITVDFGGSVSFSIGV